MICAWLRSRCSQLFWVIIFQKINSWKNPERLSVLLFVINLSKWPSIRSITLTHSNLHGPLEPLLVWQSLLLCATTGLPAFKCPFKMFCWAINSTLPYNCIIWGAKVLSCVGLCVLVCVCVCLQRLGDTIRTKSGSFSPLKWLKSLHKHTCVFSCL